MDDLQSRGSYLKNEAGKGDKPRSCFSDDYRSNYELINWSKKAHKIETVNGEQNPQKQ